MFAQSRGGFGCRLRIRYPGALSALASILTKSQSVPVWHVLPVYGCHNNRREVSIWKTPASCVWSSSDVFISLVRHCFRLPSFLYCGWVRSEWSAAFDDVITPDIPRRCKWAIALCVRHKTELAAVTCAVARLVKITSLRLFASIEASLKQLPQSSGRDQLSGPVWKRAADKIEPSKSGKEVACKVRRANRMLNNGIA